MNSVENSNKLDDQFDIETQLIVYNFLGLIATNENNNDEIYSLYDIKESSDSIKEYKDPNVGFQVLYNEIKKGKKLKSVSPHPSDIDHIKKAVISELKHRNRSFKDFKDQDINMTIIQKNKKVKVLIHKENSIPDQNIQSFTHEHKINKNSVNEKNKNSIDIYLVTPVNDLDQPQFDSHNIHSSYSIQSFQGDEITTNLLSSKIKQQEEKFTYSYMDIKSLNESDMKNRNLYSRNIIELKKEINNAIIKLQKERNNKLLPQNVHHSIVNNVDYDLMSKDRLLNNKSNNDKYKVLSNMNYISQSNIREVDFPNSICSTKEDLVDLMSIDSPRNYHMTIEGEISEILRSIGDELENEHRDVINRSLAKLHLNIQNIKEWLPTVLLPIISLTSGWKKVTLIILLGQKLCSLLMNNVENANQINVLVTEISRYIRENCYVFIIQHGGWRALSEQWTLFSSDKELSVYGTSV